MKKIIALTLALLMMASALFMFAGCGKNESSDATMPSLNTSIDADATDYSNDENTGNDNASKKPDRQEMSTPDLADYVQERTVTISIEDEDGNTGAAFLNAENSYTANLNGDEVKVFFLNSICKPECDALLSVKQ